jgi:hypothetical protein
MDVTNFHRNTEIKDEIKPLTPWSRFLPEKLKVAQPVKKYPII